MLIVYDSLGKTEKFVKKTGLPSIKLTKDLIVNEPFVLVTYTRGGRTQPPQPPQSTFDFLENENNSNFLLGVASTGHRNWGKDRFARAGDVISQKYDVPLIHKIEMSGYPKDVEIFKKGVYKIYGKNISRV